MTLCHHSSFDQADFSLSQVAKSMSNLLSDPRSDSSMALYNKSPCCCCATHSRTIQVVSITVLYIYLLLIGLSAQNQRYDKLETDEKPKNQRLKRLEDKMEDLEGKSQSWKDRLPSRKMVKPICTDGSSFNEQYKVLRTRVAGFGVHGPLG